MSIDLLYIILYHFLLLGDFFYTFELLFEFLSYIALDITTLFNNLDNI